MWKPHFPGHEPDLIVDLSSDTASRPGPGMYEAMIRAPVGDEQKGTDPTVNSLCNRVAGLLGKEQAIFLPSGVMCNMIGILTQCQRGDEVIAGAVSHLLNMEGGAPAALAGVTIRPVDGPNGIFDAGSVKMAIRRSSKRNVARTALIAIEQTCNRGGGSIWPLDTLMEISAIARQQGIAMHMDGARLLNASVASGVAPHEYAAPFATVWLDLSKGLGCPVGAVLSGASDIIQRAWIWKHRLGGAMRQAGVLAAAGLYALDRYVGQLTQDHYNAKHLAAGLQRVPGIRLKWLPQTNMVFLDVTETGRLATEIAAGMIRNGVSLGVESDFELRAVTHLDVTRKDIDTAIQTLMLVLESG